MPASMTFIISGKVGSCDALINGAGGNNPRATTDKEYFELGDLELSLIHI